MVLIGLDEITEEYRLALEGFLPKAQVEEDGDFLRERVTALGQTLGKE